jgi:hypothetical protein
MSNPRQPFALTPALSRWETEWTMSSNGHSKWMALTPLLPMGESLRFRG